MTIVWSVFKHSPVPFFVFVGIFLGVLLYFGFEQSAWSRWVWLSTLTLGGVPIVYKTIKGILRGQFASDIVAMLAIVTAFLLDQVFTGAVIVLMQSGGEAIEAYGMRRATFSLTALLARAPRIARRKQAEGMEEINVQDVKVDDILFVQPGDLIPVDGIILEGRAEIDESALTGEPLARSKTVADQVFSGSVDVNGAFVMRACKISEDSQYAKIVLLVKKAQEEKSPIQRLADKYAIFFTPLTILMAVLGFLITRDSSTILAVLVVATPCLLILATPLAVMCGINKAANEGIIVKGGAALELVASTQAALFDKTGTITYGTPFVEKIVSITEKSVEQILCLAAILDQFSSHSVAKAIVSNFLESGEKLPLPHSFKEWPGQGVEGEIEGIHYLLGSRSFLEDKSGHKIGQYDAIMEQFYGQNKLLVFLAKKNACIGYFVLSDQIRPGMPALVQSLYSLGVKKIVMLTGDGQINAETIAKQAGIETFEANLLPEQKVEKVRELTKSYFPLIMVGDGINDAPALATATVGIAMGAYGTAISAEAADIVFLVDDLGKVVDIIKIGKRMIFIAKQSIFIGMGLSFILMVIASLGYIMPVVGACLQEIIDVAVILNALRAR